MKIFLLFSKLHNTVPWIVDIGPTQSPPSLVIIQRASGRLDIYIWDQYFANLRLWNAESCAKLHVGCQPCSQDIHLKSGQGVSVGLLEKYNFFKVKLGEDLRPD